MMTGKAKKISESKVLKGNSRKTNVSEIIVGKDKSANLETNVSVFTKTTNPKVVIQSEKVCDSSCFIGQNICGCRFLKTVCLLILGIILLMIFFLSLRTYNIVNELHHLLIN